MTDDYFSVSSINSTKFEIFEKISKNKDGCISVKELKEALQKKSQLKDTGKMLQKANVDNILFEQFLEFVKSQETQLKLAFKQMDRNHDNKIDANEIRETFADMGITIDIEEAKQLLARMDLDNSLTIDYVEWRKFLFSSNASNLNDIIKYWRNSCFIDIGESIVIPTNFTLDDTMTGLAWKTLLSGGIAGCVSRTATAPLDRIKVTMQAHGAKASNHGIINTIKYMINEGGISSLWRGNGVSCLKIGPESAIKFLAYETYKQWICRIRNNNSGEVNLEDKFIAGALAGATAQTIIFPMEVLKTRMCLRKSGQYSSLFDCTKQVYLHERLPGFFRGYVPNLLGILPYAGIDLALFETFKNLYLKSVDQTTHLAIPVYVSLIAGATSSTCGQFVTYPLALIRTKLQATPMLGTEKTTMTSIFKTIMKQEGVAGLYRGIIPNTLKVIPAVSIAYAVFDQTRYRLGIG